MYDPVTTERVLRQMRNLPSIPALAVIKLETQDFLELEAAANVCADQYFACLTYLIWRARRRAEKRGVRSSEDTDILPRASNLTARNVVSEADEKGVT